MSDSIHPNENWHADSKKSAIRRFLILFGAVVSLFALFNLQKGNWVIGYLEATLALISFGSWRFASSLSLNAVEIISLSQITVLTYAFLFFDAVGDSAYIWIIVYPFYIFYLIGMKKGLHWIIGLAAALTLTSIVVWLQGIQLYWPWEMGPYLLGDYIIVSLIAHLFSLQTDRYIQLLHQSEARSKTLLFAIERAGESIMITDRKGALEYVNPAFTKMTGYNAKEVLGQTPRILKSGNQDDAFYTAMWKDIAAGNIWHQKVIDKKKDGSFLPVLVTIAPIKNERDQITHFVGVHADLTELNNLEQQFHQAQKMESIGIMVGGIAHNFNNMLAGMTGNLYLAKQKVQTQPDVLKKLSNVEDLSRRAADMIAQLLAFARKSMVQIKEMSFTLLIKETLQLLTAAIPENIIVHQHLCRDDLPIQGDGTLLHQVLANLISNARDAVENEEDPSITIRLEPFHASEDFVKAHTDFKLADYAHLSVTDNGMGIPKARIEHLFEPFFTTKEQGKGTGLGLSMVFGAIKTHHGFVEVTSIEGESTTFHIYIPLLKEKAVAVDTVQKNTGCQGNNELILLADDEPMVREVMAEVLQDLGYQVLKAKDGLQAIEIFRTHHQEIALTLLDVVMPHLGGLPLASKIRAINPNIPVIFLTGYDQQHVLIGNQPMVNSETLSKPVDYDILNQKIQQLLTSH